MKILKLLVIAYLITKPALVQAQIIISEVNFDVPGSEKIGINKHYGEFIELFNYSDRDISLNGFMIKDLASVFHFPANTVIKSRDYIVVAYKNNTTNDNPITSFYPSSIGHESKIIYQNKIRLRNRREKVELITNKINSYNLRNYYVISSINYRTFDELLTYGSQYEFQFNSFDYYNINNVFQTSLPINYANFPSINYKHEEGYTINPPNPFVLHFPPPLTPFNHSISNILENEYNNITYDADVLIILNNTCDKTVATIEQSPSLTLTTQKRCAVYDVSGNITHWTTCTNITPPPPIGYTEEQIQQIDAAITVFPNPTTGAVTTQWDTLYLGKIKLIHAATSAGNIFYTSPSLLNTTTAPINLGNGSMGLYLITFVLDTDQIITRNVIKY